MSAKDIAKFLQQNESMINQRHLFMEGAQPAKLPEGQSHFTISGWAAEHCKPYESQALTDDEMAWLFELIDADRRRYQIKQCYYNAQMMLLFADAWDYLGEGAPELQYVEGYAHGLIAVNHGWLTLNGKVVDLTMRLRKPVKRTSHVGRRRLVDRVLGEFGPERAYLGAPFPVAASRAYLDRTGMLGTLIDDWQGGYPILHPAHEHYPLKENNDVLRSAPQPA